MSIRKPSACVTECINNSTARFGFFTFSTLVNRSRGIQSWDQNELLSYVDGLYWTTGTTNTEQLIIDALDGFDTTCKANRQQVFVLITDGTPYIQGVGYINLCGSDYDYDSQLESAGIYCIIHYFHFEIFYIY